MGEYALYHNTCIKLGTCEDMQYLRADQAQLVTVLPGNVDPVREGEQIRFRFPFPDEDDVEPGAFTDPERSLTLNDVRPPEDLSHRPVRFTSEAGYTTWLACPQGPPTPGVRFRRTGASWACGSCSSARARAGCS